MSARTSDPIFISERQAMETVDLRAAVAALRSAFAAQAARAMFNAPRFRAPGLGRSLNVTAARDASNGRYAVKVYGGGAFHILLYSDDRGLLAVMEADWLGQARTGAATALATELMAKRSPCKIGVIGAGRQARAQLLALGAIGQIRAVSVYARRRDRLKAFCAGLEGELGVAVIPAATAQDAVADAGVVVTATTSSTPVLSYAWLAAGAHVNAVGANAPSRRELDADIIEKASMIVVDDVEQARREAGELIELDARGRFDWNSVRPLHALIGVGRPPWASLTVFKSLGVGIEDLAIASLAYDRIVAGQRE